MNEIHLKLSVEEANLILEGLGNLPFAKVYQLVANLQQQASQQVESDTATANGANGAEKDEASSLVPAQGAWDDPAESADA
jgi:hypothetical protein